VEVSAHGHQTPLSGSAGPGHPSRYAEIVCELTYAAVAVEVAGRAALAQIATRAIGLYLAPGARLALDHHHGQTCAAQRESER
jgi:hypothetical protein